MFAVTVTFRIKPEHVDSFREAVRLQARNSLEREKSCRQFDVCYSEDDRCLVFLYELYDNRAAFDQHVQTEHFQSFSKMVESWVASKDVRCWTRAE